MRQVLMRALAGGAQVCNDQSCVTDWIGGEGGGLLLGDFGAQPFGRLSDGKREGRVLLNLSKMFYRIPVPSWKRESGQPRLGGARYGASSTDSCLSLVVVSERGLGCREFLFNQRCWCHQALPMAEALHGESLVIVIN